MDLNYLYYRQQVSMMRADRAACDASRKAHLGLAELYSQTIARRPGASRSRALQAVT
jgi:hypothetical protein